MNCTLKFFILPPPTIYVTFKQMFTNSTVILFLLKNAKWNILQLREKYVQATK